MKSPHAIIGLTILATKTLQPLDELVDAHAGELSCERHNCRAGVSFPLNTDPSTKLDEVMIGALRRAHALVKLDRQRLPICDNAPPTLYERRLLRLAFLAPDLQAMILEGRQPAHLNVEQLIEQPLPIDWNEQRKIFGSTEPPSRAENRKAAPPLA